MFAEVEEVCSRFLPGSELSIINSGSQIMRHRLSPLLAEGDPAADVARSLTEGLVDIGVGSAVTAWGIRPDLY